MYVSCSTLCFGQQPLHEALKSISEMGFTKVEVSVAEDGPHLTPAEIARDPARAAQMLKSLPGISASAFQMELNPKTTCAEAAQQLKAVCRLSRMLAVSMVSVPADTVDADFEAELQRLTYLVRVCEAEGVSLAVESRMGTFTETPSRTIEMCKRVAGLGISLDPSHYVAGPFQSQEFDELYPFVKHVRLRDSAKSVEKFQVRVGQGEIEYGRIVNQLSKHRYARTLSVEMRDTPDQNFPMQPEVRKLKYLLESLI